MPKKKSWNDNDLSQAVQSSYSKAEVMRKLKINPSGGTYTWLSNHIKRLNLDTSHFLGKAHLKGKNHSWTAQMPLKDILISNSNYNRGHLKKRLLKEGLLENQCSICKSKEWMEKPLVLQLDHINGVGNDNRIENLRLLCPNCHSQTDTYCR